MRRYQPSLLQRKPYQRYTPEQIDYIHTAAASGVPMQTITKKLKTSHISVRVIMHRHGMSIKHVRNTHTMTASELRRYLGISYEATVAMIKACGITKTTGKYCHHWLTTDQVTQVLRDQRFWWRWRLEWISLDWLRELAETIRSEPTTGQWLPTLEAAQHYGISRRAIVHRIAANALQAQRIGNMYIVWCPKE
jgi:DNA-binding transcriptional regulator YiaG